MVDLPFDCATVLPVGVNIRSSARSVLAVHSLVPLLVYSSAVMVQLRLIVIRSSTVTPHALTCISAQSMMVTMDILRNMFRCLFNRLSDGVVLHAVTDDDQLSVTYHFLSSDC